MKIFVINLKRNVDKLERILTQFKKYNIVDYEIVSAVDGNTLTKEQLKNLYNDKAASNLIYSMSGPEIGCALSHLKVYEKILKQTKRCLILEDDVEIDERIIQFKDMEIESNTDILFFGLFTSNIEQNCQNKTYQYQKINRSPNDFGHITRCYLKNTYEALCGIDFFDIDEQSYKIDFLCGAHAYSPSFKFCENALQINTPVKVMADMIWNYKTSFTLKVPEISIINQNTDLNSDLRSSRSKNAFSKKFIFRRSLNNFGI